MDISQILSSATNMHLMILKVRCLLIEVIVTVFSLCSMPKNKGRFIHEDSTDINILIFALFLVTMRIVNFPHQEEY